MPVSTTAVHFRSLLREESLLHTDIPRLCSTSGGIGLCTQMCLSLWFCMAGASRRSRCLPFDTNLDEIVCGVLSSDSDEEEVDVAMRYVLSLLISAQDACSSACLLAGYDGQWFMHPLHPVHCQFESGRAASVLVSSCTRDVAGAEVLPACVKLNTWNASSLAVTHASMCDQVEHQAG